MKSPNAVYCIALLCLGGGIARADFVFNGLYYQGPRSVQVPGIAVIGAYQHCLSWCWAAAAETLTRSQGIVVPQEYLVEKVYPTLSCSPAYAPQVIAALNDIYPTMSGGYVKVRGSLVQGQDPAAPLVALSELQKGTPFILFIPGHYVVGYGAEYYEKYDAFGNYYGSWVSRLYFQDPFFVWSPMTNPQFNYIDFTNPLNGAAIQAVITVASEPVFPVSLQDFSPSRTVGYGERVVLQSSASGSPPLIYRWFKDGKMIAGQGPQLTIRSATFKSAGTYYVTIVNEVNTITSGAATITVVDVAPIFIVQPKNRSVKVGANVSLAAKAKSRTPLTYQWLFNGNPIAGATKSSLRFTKVTESHAGEYALVASNAFGDTTSEKVRLIVNP